MEKFCPKCGKTVEKLFGPRKVCVDCYREAHDFVEIPDEINFDQCSVCGNYKIKNVWKGFESDEKLVFDVLGQYEKEDVEMGASFKRQGEVYNVKVVMEENINGERIRQVKEVQLVPEKKQCRKCSRFHGGYFEAILQIRGDVTENIFGEMMEFAGRKTSEDRSNFVSNVEEIHGGYDVYVSSMNMLRSILQFLKERLKVEEEWSKELVGQKEGQEVYRTVVSARISG